MGKKIYVETFIKAPIDSVWEYTQNPQLHQQWDLRFSEINYLPKVNEQDRQKFLYRTNIGFGLSIAGEGESYGTKEVDGVRTSSLVFGTEQRISLIELGSGFWRYIPKNGGVTFLTLYDYRTRFGWLGRYFDSIVFRPMIGWATAWSFDALRLWLELGIHPRSSILRCLRYWIVSIVLCFLWVYQGLVPKLLFANTGELELISQIGLFRGYEPSVLAIAGVLEILFGLTFLFIRKRNKLLHYINIFLLIGLLLSGMAFPSVFLAPFNPITLNGAMIALSATQLLENEPLATAKNCLRTERRGKEGV